MGGGEAELGCSMQLGSACLISKFLYFIPILVYMGTRRGLTGNFGEALQLGESQKFTLELILSFFCFSPSFPPLTPPLLLLLPLPR